MKLRLPLWAFIGAVIITVAEFGAMIYSWTREPSPVSYRDEQYDPMAR